jgi:hypothetical protein
MKVNVNNTVAVFYTVYHKRYTKYMDINFSKNADVTWNENRLILFLSHSFRPTSSLYCTSFSSILAFSNIQPLRRTYIAHKSQSEYEQKKSILFGHNAQYN